MKTVTYNDTKWRLVPVEPTEEMVDEGCRQHVCEQGDPHYSEPPLGYGDCVEVYLAMIAAAPTPPESAESDRLDAERYRWLRDEALWLMEASTAGTKIIVRFHNVKHNFVGSYSNEFDSAIDQAMTTEGNIDG